MKKIIVLTTLFIVVSVAAFSQATTYTTSLPSGPDYAGAMASKLDTLTNADTAYYDATIVGAKQCVSFQVNVTKLTGTLAGKIDVFGSIDGTNWIPTALVSQQTITDASGVFAAVLTSNSYKKYRLRVITSGTNTSSHRAYLLYRAIP
jgi:hypothetical protein